MRLTVLPLLIALVSRLFAASWRVTRQGTPPVAGEILAILHGEVLPTVLLHRGGPLTLLASRSRDGELAARVMDRLRLRVVRGSSGGGGREGLDALEAVLREGALTLMAVDGSRGPRGVPKAGAVALARRTGASIVALRVFARPALRLNSWDRFCIPLPFARLTLRYVRIADTTDFERAMEDLRGALAEPPGSAPPDPIS